MYRIVLILVIFFLIISVFGAELNGFFSKFVTIVLQEDTNKDVWLWVTKEVVLFGETYDANTGDPVSEIPIYAFSEGADPLIAAPSANTTSVNGNYSLTLTTGNYDIYLYNYNASSPYADLDITIDKTQYLKGEEVMISGSIQNSMDQDNYRGGMPFDGALVIELKFDENGNQTGGWITIDEMQQDFFLDRLATKTLNQIFGYDPFWTVPANATLGDYKVYGKFLADEKTITSSWKGFEVI